MADAVQGETYLVKAMPENAVALTVMDVDDEYVYVVKHHAALGLEGGIYRLRRAAFEALYVPCHRPPLVWRANLPDSGRE